MKNTCAPRHPGTLSRRQMLKLLGATAVMCTPTWARAALPQGPLTLVVPFPAGGQFDTIGRAVAQAMGAALNKTIIVENIGGAGGTIAAGRVVRAAPDGQTLLLYGGNLASAGGMYKSLDYDPLNDLQAVSRISIAPHVIVASPRSGITTFAQLQSKLKNGEKLSYGSPGVGTSMHLTMELVKQKLGMDILHVPYRGGAVMMTDLIAGNIDLGIIAIGPALNFIQSKKVAALGVTSKARSTVAPDVPSLSEMGVEGIDTGSWAGLSVPKATSPALVEELNALVLRSLDSAAVKHLFKEQGFIATPSTPLQMKEYAQSEAKAFDPVIRKLQL